MYLVVSVGEVGSNLSNVSLIYKTKGGEGNITEDVHSRTLKGTLRSSNIWLSSGFELFCEIISCIAHVAIINPKQLDF